MEHYSGEAAAQREGALRDAQVDVEIEQQQMIDAGAEWYVVDYKMTFFGGNEEHITERVLAFSEDDAANIVKGQFHGIYVVAAISERDLEAA